MNHQVIDLTDEQVTDIEQRLEAYDEVRTGPTAEGDVEIGVVVDGKLVAGASGTMTSFDIFYLSTLFVDEDHRGTGLGRRLMETIEQRAAALGARLIRLDTFDWQGPGFYERLGYEQVGHYAADGFAEHFFLKRL